MDLASGADDNKCILWRPHETEDPFFIEEGNSGSAIKALDWSPHQRGILATGGGTHDPYIRFWDMKTQEETSCLYTGSQITNLVYSKSVNEILTTHGYHDFDLKVWDCNKMGRKVGSLKGHSGRILYLSMSPDGQRVVTGCAEDETLRFWEVFP